MRRLDSARLGQVLTFAGVLMTAGIGLATIVIQGGQARERARCELARDLLQDETPSPYLSIVGRRQVVTAAVRRMGTCLKD